MSLPDPLERLVVEFSRLPGIGRKTAQRLAFGVLRYSPEEARRFSEAIVEVKQRVRPCSECGAFTEEDPCRLCTDARRDRTMLCVVEQPNNIFPLEKSGVFRGLYHVLMGAISPLEGIGPAQLRIAALKRRVLHEGVQELVLATNPSVAGEATALFLQQEFSGLVPRITRLARGLPSGSDLDYVDDVTLMEAFSGRQAF
jgi:recombination protein RecR